MREMSERRDSHGLGSDWAAKVAEDLHKVVDAYAAEHRCAREDVEVVIDGHGLNVRLYLQHRGAVDRAPHNRTR